MTAQGDTGSIAVPHASPTPVGAGRVRQQSVSSPGLVLGLDPADGDDDFDYLRQSDSIFVDNSIQ